MKIGTFRAWFLAVIVALVSVWAFVPSVADTHPLAGAAEVNAEHGHGDRLVAATAADCAGAIGAVAHGACCGASTFACCASCLLLPTELAAAAPGGTPIFASALDETAAGLPPARFKRPPRLAR